jgi:hypothetical protein
MLPALGITRLYGQSLKGGVMENGRQATERLLANQCCVWCGNNLASLRNVYKGKDSERWYCSTGHLLKGEERHLRKVAQGAGRSFAFDVVS